MTEKEVTGLALRLFAIYVLVESILAIPPLLGSLIATKDFMGEALASFWLWVAGALAVTVSLVIAAVLWRLASKTIQSQNATDTNANTGNFEPSILSALGVFLVIHALVRLSYISTGAYVQATRFESGEVSLETAALIGAYLFQGIVGVSLVLGSRGWAALLEKLRNAGLSSKDV